MAGRIADADVARVRELSPIETVVADYVALRSAGGGSPSLPGSVADVVDDDAARRCPGRDR